MPWRSVRSSVPAPRNCLQVNRITIDVPEPQRNMRYPKIPGKAVNVGEATAYQNGSPINGTGWRASNVFADYTKAPAKQAWSGSFRLDEAATGSYLVVPCNGKHGRDGAYLTHHGNWCWRNKDCRIPQTIPAP